MPRQEQSFDDSGRSHSSALLRTALLITWDDREAEDLVQEFLWQVFRRWRRIPAMDMPLAYARRLLINLALAGRDQRRRRVAELRRVGRRHPRVDLGSEFADPTAEGVVESVAERAELVNALGSLTPQQRTVLVLRYFEDLSETQVAELLGCSTGTVKSSASRGLARLRELLSQATPTTEVRER
jgi:RNA polymerase sigma-70 factor (sigma-E family)